MEPRTHRISLTKTAPGWLTYVKGPTPFEVDFAKELEVFTTAHPNARVPEGRPPELIAYGDDVAKRFETVTFKPEDFNDRVLKTGYALLIHRGVNLAIKKCAEKLPGYKGDGWLDMMRRVRSLVQRVDVQFVYIE